MNRFFIFPKQLLCFPLLLSTGIFISIIPIGYVSLIFSTHCFAKYLNASSTDYPVFALVSKYSILYLSANYFAYEYFICLSYVSSTVLLLPGQSYYQSIFLHILRLICLLSDPSNIFRFLIYIIKLLSKVIRSVTSNIIRTPSAFLK